VANQPTWGVHAQAAAAIRQALMDLAENAPPGWQKAKPNPTVTFSPWFLRRSHHRRNPELN